MCYCQQPTVTDVLEPPCYGPGRFDTDKFLLAVRIFMLKAV